MLNKILLNKGEPLPSNERLLLSGRQSNKLSQVNFARHQASLIIFILKITFHCNKYKVINVLQIVKNALSTKKIH